MNKIEDYVEIIDITTKEDDPYDNWKKTPDEKFIEELKKEGYTPEEIYTLDADKEEGILVDYDLLPHESIKWDKKEKVMKLKMKYTPLLKYRKALIDLGINYVRRYWERL